jgi:membrane fusion protein, multidrug efflux system
MTEKSSPKTLRKKIPLIAAAAVVLIGLWGLRRYQEYRMYRTLEADAQSASSETPRVKAYRVRPQNVVGALKRIGTIRAKAETNLQFGAPGRVATFSGEKGQFVKRGSVLAALDQQEAKNALKAIELEYERASNKYFKDRTIDRLEYERSKARYTQARLEADKTVIRAPHDGYLVEKWVNAGEQVEGGTPIGKLMDKSQVSVEMDLSEDDIQHLKTGQKVEITVDAVPDFKGGGEVISITPYMKGDTRSFNVKVRIPENPKEVLSPGMFARCTVRRYEKSGAMMIPLEAGAEMQEKNIRLFTVDDQNVLHERTLPVIFMDENRVEAGELAEGDVVVLNPGADLQNGAKVEVVGVFDPASQQDQKEKGPSPAPPAAVSATVR